jgi:uncharacterized protein (TIGR02118 family)
MTRVTVLYPNEQGKRFDHGYYAEKHMPLVADRLRSFGLRRYEVDRGVAGGAPNAPAPFVAACHLFFDSAAEFQKGMGTHGKEIMADIANYTDIQPTVQISDVVVS